MGAAASVVIAPVTVAIGFALTTIKDRYSKVKMLAANVKKVVTVVETRKTARIFAGILTFGLSELLNHKTVHEEISYEDDYIGSNKKEEKYKGNLNRTEQKIREAVEKQLKEEAVRREQEAAIRRESEEAAKRKQENERQAIEALQLENARTKSKTLLDEATNIYDQAEAMNSLELKLETYEKALFKCGESCASDATEAAFNTLNKIFESCLKHDSYDEAEIAVQIAKKYFPNEAGCLQDVLNNQQAESWSPDYVSRARRQQEQKEQNRTITIMLA